MIIKKILLTLVAISAIFGASPVFAETKTAILAGGCFWCVQNDVGRATADAVKQVLKTDINVDILDAKKFWPAEDYHQDYAKKNHARYEIYRWNCGRDARVKKVWGDK